MATMDWFGEQSEMEVSDGTYLTREKELQRDKLTKRRLEEMNDEQATEFITKIIQKDQELLDLRSDLVSKLGEVITPIQTLRLFQAERAFKER